MQWLQDPTQTNVMQNCGTRAKLEGSSGKKRGKIIKANNKNWDLYKDTREFKIGCQRRTNLLKDKNGDLVAASHSTLGMEKK